MLDSNSVLIRPGQLHTVRRWSRGAQRTSAQRPVDVTDVRQETTDAVSLTLRPADGKPLTHQPGQYLTLHADIAGRRVKRAYSISGAGENNTVTVTIKGVADGVFSRWALTQCAPGQRLHMAGPTGDFVLPETLPARYVFLAAGSGITPVIHLLDTVLKRQPDARVHLFYGSRTEAGILFRERLQAREQAHPGLTVHHVLSQPDASWSGLRGRLRADLLNDVPELSDSECYICGPGDCIAQLDAALRDRSVPASRIHSEHYTAGVHAVAAHPTEPHPVRFAQSGKDITVRPGESILEAGLRSGLDLPFSCTMGGCGHCKLSLSSGTLIMDEPNCLDPRERDDGAFLACCAYPTSRMEVQA